MAEEKLWHYKGLVRPAEGYLGSWFEEGTMLVVVKARNALAAEAMIYQILVEKCLAPTGLQEIGETTVIPRDLSFEVQRVYEDAAHLGSASLFQPGL
jgi:hypothetical protein